MEEEDLRKYLNPHNLMKERTFGNSSSEWFVGYLIKGFCLFFEQRWWNNVESISKILSSYSLRKLYFSLTLYSSGLKPG